MTVAKLEDNVERIVINIVPLTFDHFFFHLFNVDLPEEFQPLVASTDPTECKPHSSLCHSESMLYIHIEVSQNFILSNK